MEKKKIKGFQLVDDDGAILFDSAAGLSLNNENADHTQLWLSGGLDLKNRVLEVTGDVNENMTSYLFRTIIKLNDMSHDPITIYFSSSGGSVYEGFAIYDLLRASPSPIIIVANGKIASMGIVIFLAATERYALPHTRFMIHSVSHETGGTLKDTLIDVNEAKTVNDMMFNVIADRTKISRKSLNLNTSHDFWFDVTQATKYGIVTTNKPKRQPQKKKGTKNGKKKYRTT